MLINSDFERHGFKLCDGGIDSRKWYSNRPKYKFDIMVSKLRKGMSRVKLYGDSIYIREEVMWSPEQLRVFLKENGILSEN